MSHGGFLKKLAQMARTAARRSPFSRDADLQRIKELILSSPKATEPAVILDEASIDSFSFHPIGRIQTAFK